VNNLTRNKILILAKRRKSVIKYEQVKLLRVLQERRYWPVGSHQERVFLGRVVGATNQPVEVLRGDYEPGAGGAAGTAGRPLTAEEVVRQYCRQLYARYGSYGEAAKAAGLDRRTVKRYVEGRGSEE